ncbi:hypothetical protein EBAPG3_001900 [Nitrosospira lacus]|nr:hypothetical protein [Nitrosospira lacus]ARO86631.2 hypothetical protein EBAPG3_001900 [Nitrosospira lacus]
MRKVSLVVLLAGIALGYGSPVLAQQGTGAQQDGVGGDGKRGGKAFEHRSQQGSENSNAQWSTGATKGKDRADLRNQDDDGRGHGKDHGGAGGKAYGHDKEHGGKAGGHDKEHGGKARGHGKGKAD